MCSPSSYRTNPHPSRRHNLSCHRRRSCTPSTRTCRRIRTAGNLKITTDLSPKAVDLMSFQSLTASLLILETVTGAIVVTVANAAVEFKGTFENSIAPIAHRHNRAHYGPLH